MSQIFFQVTPINIVGMIICLFGLSAHVVNKGLNECTQKKTHSQESTRVSFISHVWAASLTHLMDIFF